MRDNDELDFQLEAALATYAHPEEVPGLSTQILASIRQMERRRKRRTQLLSWAIALPTAAALLLAILIPMRHLRPHHAGEAQQAAMSNPSPAPTLAPRKQPYAHTSAPSEPRTTAHYPRTQQQQLAARKHPGPEQPLPKREVFPTPTPLTPQEQALAALVKKNPGNVAQAVAESQQQPVEPLSIAAIQIPLINPPGKGEN